MAEGIQTVNDSDFATEVLESSLPVLVDFWAEWCEPCKRFEPVLVELAAHYAGRVKIAKLNVEQFPQTPRQFNVRGLPTFILFKGGKPHAQQIGAVSKSQMLNFIDRAI